MNARGSRLEAWRLRLDALLFMLAAAAVAIALVGWLPVAHGAGAPVAASGRAATLPDWRRYAAWHESWHYDAATPAAACSH